MKDVGAIYEDKEVVVDRNLVTSRQPFDLAAFLRETTGLNCNIFRNMRR